jgi:hypothetical protein
MDIERTMQERTQAAFISSHIRTVSFTMSCFATTTTTNSKATICRYEQHDSRGRAYVTQKLSACRELSATL